MKIYLLFVVQSFLIFLSESEPYHTCEKESFVLPKLWIIGSQKGGTSSLFADLKSSYQGMLMSTACRNRHDPKECNVFTTHSTLHNLYHNYGKKFCRKNGTTANYCTRLRNRGFKISSFFTSQYDKCNVSSEPCSHPLSNKSSCIPLIPIDASPTYATRPHVNIQIYVTFIYLFIF